MLFRSARAAYNMGAKRVVLAREMSLQDIATLRDKTPPELEIEAFVHGAMCMSISGRCLLSNYMAGRDEKRGQCAQHCRKQRPKQMRQWKWKRHRRRRQGSVPWHRPEMRIQDVSYTVCLLYTSRDVADRILFMDGGVVVEEGPAKQLIDHPREERTRQFLAHYSE